MISPGGPDCVAAELCGVLSTPIQFRCHRLNAMINSYHPRDLQNIFPQLVDSIFNSRGGQGWGLRVITQSSNEFDLLHDFFSPLGPFLRLCYRLLDDNIKFLLPISYLPQLLRNKLSAGNNLSNFYKET
ncbi:sphingomyelin phosphodiesterase 4-like [Ctenocephalides felis]|uniref:sphingomyelin phosphodiesterase 4-like n=1 Tax=Ctenocephalides felis TaxID=7515 RepID=UPI000E6E3C44|nr:sphingomyelin phosphodiesterase 4-like [Ctenocephalides felis]